MGQGFAPEYSLIVNVENPLIKKLSSGEGENGDMLAKQIYSLAVLSQRRFDENEMKEFLSSSYSLLEKLI